jgi:hypothetical protein
MQQRTEHVLWGTSAVFIIVAIVASRGGTMARAAATPSSHPQTAVMMFDPDQFAMTAEQTTAHDLFRLARKPSSISFGTPDLPPTPPAPPATPFQSLTLKGILGGPPWQAIFAGVPNRGDNVVARVGDTLAGLRVTRIRHDGVVLKGRDTLLTLTFTRTWQ